MLEVFLASPSSVARELLLLGCLSSLRLQEEQMARAAPLLSLPGSTSCHLLSLTPVLRSPGSSPRLSPHPRHEALWQEDCSYGKPPGRRKYAGHRCWLFFVMRIIILILTLMGHVMIMVMIMVMMSVTDVNEMAL